MKARHELNTQMFMDKINGHTHQPQNNENKKYAAVQNGDIDTVRKHLSNDPFPHTLIFSDNPIKNLIYCFVIDASSLSKICTEGGMSSNEACTISEIYIRKADKCNTEKQLVLLYKDMFFDFTERMQEIKKQKVISLHIRKCIDYIYEHLGESLTVNSLADYLGLNPSYLSKLFAKETGETLKSFVIAAKMDTAQNLLKYSDFSYLDISNALGFSSQSAFISVFKKCTGLTPKIYREKFYALK